MTEDEIRAIMNALQEQRTAAQQNPYGNNMPGANPNANKPPAVAPSDASKVTIAYAPVFYPGAMTSNQATTVTLGAGEERTGLDFSLRLVKTATVEDHPADAGALRPLPNQLADAFGDIALLAFRRAQVRLQVRRGYQRAAGNIVDHLGVDMGQAAVDRQSRPLGRAAHPLA